MGLRDRHLSIWFPSGEEVITAMRAIILFQITDPSFSVGKIREF
jgi:hypothetical protein